jgi:hypothetical protein
MIAIRSIAACGPIADCTVCEPREIENLCIEFWNSSEVFDLSLLDVTIDNGCLICVPADFCGGSIVYAYPLANPCAGSADEFFNCSDDEEFGTVICAPAHNNYMYAGPCGSVGTRAQWIRETYCCTREAA